MPVVIILAVIVVLAAVVFLAMGRGGELSVERSDYVPLDLGPVSATDIALLRPPTGVWGYNMEATDEAMDQIAESIRERDVRIVALEQLVTDLSKDHAPMPLLASPFAGARHRRARGDTTATESVQPPWGTAGTEEAAQEPSESAEAESETVQPPWGTTETEAVQEPSESAEAVQPPWGTTDTDAVQPPWGTGVTEEVQEPWGTGATESVRLPFDQPRPGGDGSAPPERSHD